MVTTSDKLFAFRAVSMTSAYYQSQRRVCEKKVMFSSFQCEFVERLHFLYISFLSFYVNFYLSF